MKKILIAYILVPSLSFLLFCNKAHSQLNAGFDVTYVVGSGPLDLNEGASTTLGTWSVPGVNLSGSIFKIPYQAFADPFIDYTATLSYNGETDTKIIRAYNAIDPIIISHGLTTVMCEGGRLNFGDLPDNPRLDIYKKSYWVNKNNAGVWEETSLPIMGSDLGVGNHTIRERYSNIVNNFIYTEYDNPVEVKPMPELFYVQPIARLCVTDPPINLRDYVNTTTDVVFSLKSGTGLSGTFFDPSVSGNGSYTIIAKRTTNGCTTTYAYQFRVITCN